MSNEQTATIINLPVENLHPHPHNPRKDLGDLSELADSIRANGIFQNLTVVPMELTDPDATISLGTSHYTIIIGHRRLAAAKLAGITELPCMIAEMDEKEQLYTMLAENMQRSDLTIYEQAQGFQMMLDLGESVESVARQSGFSQSTVRRRIKLTELNKDKFKKAVDRGATLFDFEQLDKIESSELRDEVLGSIGTKNFQQKLQAAIDGEKKAKYLAAAQEAVKPYAERIEKTDYQKMRFVKGLSIWQMDKEIVLPEDIQTAKYYYVVSDRSIDLYRDKADEPIDEEEEARKAAAAKRQARFDNLFNELKEVSERCFRLRKAFVKDFGSAKKHLSVVAKYAGKCLVTMMERHYGAYEFDGEILHDLLCIGEDEDFDDYDMGELYEAFDKKPEYTLLVMSYAAIDGREKYYFKREWKSEVRGYVAEHHDNGWLDLVYEMLGELGYEMSDEELQMQDGTHPLFSVNIDSEEEEENICTLCKSAHPFCDKCCNTCDDKCNTGQMCRKESEATA